MLKTGYNLVRGHAITTFREDVAHRFHLPRPATLSIVTLLRHIRRREQLPHKVLQVTGLPDLWRVVPPRQHEELANWLRLFLYRRMNWLQGENPYIYFLIPDTVTFDNALHLSLRLSSDIYADMTAVFGHLTQENSEHYHHNFTVSQV
jgi:hypothetical protein